MSTDATFTAKQARFIAEFMVDSNGTQAAIRAGYAPGSAKVAASRMLSKDNAVRRAIQARQAVESERCGVTRQQVIQGILEAIGKARAAEDAMGMIRGWTALAKLMGYYAPVLVNVGVSAADKAERGRFESMTDAELMAVIAEGADPAG